MTNKERRDAQMAYISDESVFEEQKICRRKLQKLNFMDRSDFDGIGRAIQDLLASQRKPLSIRRFSAIMERILRWGRTFLLITIVRS